ncbi:MAG TPA: SpoIID/LytB domain-containing protein, partial [Acidimicrobiales bacterium]
MRRERAIGNRRLGDRRGRAVALAAGLVVASLVPLGVLSSPASAYPSSSVTIQGHGYGHGHGMGQWGALGYALAQTTYPSILGTYYGGTSLTTLTAPQQATTVHVDMTENDGNQVIVTSATPFTVAGVGFSGGQVALISIISTLSGPAWAVWSSPTCAGYPDGSWNQVVPDVSNPMATPSPDDGSETLTLCLGGPNNVTVHGSITATFNSNGAARTVNDVPLEQYVDGVVPNESPASWGALGGAGPQGQPWGFQELEAQAVAVRSYVLAGLGSYGGYADTCDLACQTYRGTLNESMVTDAAVTATQGQVMEFPGGAVAATQYSASTGG